MKNAITVIDQELIDYFDEMLPYCSDVKPTNFPFYKIDELHKMAKDLIEINAELTKREQELSSAIKDIPDKVDSSLHLKGLDRPTEFAISQAKTRAIGAVMDKVRSAKKLTKGE